MELNIYLPSKQPLSWTNDNLWRCKRPSTQMSWAAKSAKAD